MTFLSAVKKAQAYSKVRKEVRKALLIELRDRVTQGKATTFEPSERHKLFSYPADLTDAHLLNMLAHSQEVPHASL